MNKGKIVTFMFIPEGTGSRHEFRMRQWVLKSIIIGLIILLLSIIAFFSFYSSVLARAAMTDKLKSENERLKKYYYKVQLLEENLMQTREIVERLTNMAGIDFEFPEIPDDSTLFASLDKPSQAILSRPATVDVTIPAGLPLQGFITQDFEIDDIDHFHPGIDLACAIGTPVLATADGIVDFALFDSTYGNMVIIKHNDSTSTIYGHNDTLLVEIGEAVSAGSRIALSGNTGKSTAPHLHYEIRIKNNPINPLE